ncbi:MAG TPA: hypothetical protein VEI97_08610 [bacterium]|nr:hypothetical protein [bacterium]
MATLYTFKNLQDEVLATLDEVGNTDTTLTLVKNFLNQAHVTRLGQDPWPFLRWDGPETFTTSTSTRFYTLHPEFWRPDYFYNRTAGEFLVEVPQRQIAQTGDRWSSDTGRTPYFRWAGLLPVAAQPTSASAITIVSSAAGDNTSAKAITIDGIVSGVRRQESITPSGTTPVASTLSFTKILAVTKAADWTGTMTMTSNSGAVTNLVLLPTEYARQYRQIELLRTPTSADTIEYVFFRQPRKMVSDNDLPDIPSPHAQILVWDALILFSGYNTDLPAQAVQVWHGLQQEMEANMRRLWLEGTAQEAHPRYIRPASDGGAVPRVFGD